MHKLATIAAMAAAIVLGAVAPGQAQASRTWVSGVGDDANPCSRTAPCKTFAGAISKTAAGGEINVLDPGGFGALTITKSIAVISDSVEAGVLVSGTNGIVISAAATDTITLRGINFDGLGSASLAGVKILSAGNVQISNCLIRGFGNATLGNGIEVQPASGNMSVVVKNCYISNNRHGIGVDPTATGQALVTIDDSVIANNAGHGVRSKGAGANIQLSGSVITGNNIGLFVNGGTIVSSGNNVIANNATNGTPTSTVPLK